MSNGLASWNLSAGYEQASVRFKVSMFMWQIVDEVRHEYSVPEQTYLSIPHAQEKVLVIFGTVQPLV